MRTSSVPRTLLLVCGSALAVSACSGEVSISAGSAEPGEEAVQLIEGRLADEAALGPLTADCSDAADIEAGGSFDCTGTTDDGQVIEFTADVTEDGTGEVNSTNLATPQGISLLAEEAAQVLSEQNGVELPADSVTCDDSQGLIIATGATLDCEVDDPQSGENIGALLTITDPENLGFRIEITG